MLCARCWSLCLLSTCAAALGRRAWVSHACCTRDEVKLYVRYVPAPTRRSTNAQRELTYYMTYDG